MKQKCGICKKKFANLMMHLQRLSKCAHWAQMNTAAIVSQTIIAAAKTNDSDNTLNESNPNRELLVVDNLSISIQTMIHMFLMHMNLLMVWILDLPCQAMSPKESQNHQMITTSINAE